MRIAIFSDSFYPELSGITDMILSVSREFAEKGHSVHLFVPRYSKKNHETGHVPYKETDLGPNVKIHRTFSFSVKAPNMQGRMYIPNIFRGFFIKEKFDIVHTHGFFGAGIDAFFFSKIKSAPLVGTNHTVIESFVQYFSKGKSGKIIEKAMVNYINFFYNLCDLVTTPSVFLLEDMKKKGLHAKSAFIPNPIDREFFKEVLQKDKIKKELSLGEFNAIYAGRLSAEKNSETLIRGFIPFAERHKDATLSVVGHGIQKQYLQEIVSKSKVPGQIKFVGPFLGEKKKILFDYFYASDIFIMPSTSENQSMCVIQAMAVGLPIIAARAGGLPELVGEDKGFLFEPDNLVEMDKYLEELYENKTLRKKIGLSGMEFAKKQSDKAISEKWISLYEKIIAAKDNK